MFEFKILKKSKNSRARLGVLKTSLGIVETPSLVPVATQAVVKTLDSQEVKETKTQILIANTFHLHLKPGEKFIKAAGGLHKFMNWQGPLMTDSGGFQVFSMGFGKDHGVGKILKEKSDIVISRGSQPKFLKINSCGVWFRSPLDGEKLFIGPQESIKIQEKLGADIIFTFDECTSPLADYGYTEQSMQRTHKWAEICLKTKKSRQAIFGIVQGGRYRKLKELSAAFVGRLPFDGFGIGGEFGDNKKRMVEMLDWVVKILPEKRPRHLFGIGYLEDIENIIKSGIDLFDCTVPTHYARRGIAFVGSGFNKTKKLNLNKSSFLKEKEPLDKNCSCFVCQNYKRNYLSHLIRAQEITGLKLLTSHNLYFFNTFIEKVREKIKRGRI